METAKHEYRALDRSASMDCDLRLLDERLLRGVSVLVERDAAAIEASSYSRDASAKLDTLNLLGERIALELARRRSAKAAA